MNGWTRGVIAAALLTSIATGRADDPAGQGAARVVACPDAVARMTGDSPAFDLDYSWPDQWPDLSGWEEDPPGV